jgi:hypothetical protein
MDDAGVSGFVDPILQARALQELARTLPAGSKAQASMFWENDHGTAGITLGEKSCVVFLFDAEQEVESLAEAGELLKAIFANRMTAVRAYEKEVFVYGGLAPTDEPSAGFSSLMRNYSSSRTMPEIDYVAKATWSSGYEEDAE